MSDTMTQPDDTRIRLLTAMGWKDLEFLKMTPKTEFILFGILEGTAYKVAPELDANLLASARDQLLTTKEEWQEYFQNLIAHCESNYQSRPYFSVAEMAEMEKLPLALKAHAILAATNSGHAGPSEGGKDL